MGCAESTNDLNPGMKKLNSKILLYGDYFNQDTRGILAMCAHSKVHINFVLIDTFKKENYSPKYQEMNPNSTVPTIVDDTHTVVIGNTQSLYKYVLNKEPHVKNALYAEAQDKQIEEMLTWFDKQMRRVSSKIIRAVVNPLVFGATPRAMREDVETFFTQIVPRLEKKLSN